MAVDLPQLGSKIRRYREEYEISVGEISGITGIPSERIDAIEAGTVEPSGDEVLIVSDFFKCDYNYFISNEIDPSFTRIQHLYRVHSEQFTKDDKWEILEFNYLCQCEQFLLEQLDRVPSDGFIFIKLNRSIKVQARDAAEQTRAALDYAAWRPPDDVFRDFRRLGYHVFRRKLGNSNISGLFLNDPAVGKCLLINFDEDVYRQRFTAAHEAAHAILDYDEDFIISYKGSRDHREVRANSFASYFLMPEAYLNRIPENRNWTDGKIVEYSKLLKVSPIAFVYAIDNQGLITSREKRQFEKLSIPRSEKEDPELSADLTIRSKQRRLDFLKRGLSDYYVGLCFDVYEVGKISRGRLAEMLLTSSEGVNEISRLYGRSLVYVD